MNEYSADLEVKVNIRKVRTVLDKVENYYPGKIKETRIKSKEEDATLTFDLRFSNIIKFDQFIQKLEQLKIKKEIRLIVDLPSELGDQLLEMPVFQAIKRIKDKYEVRWY